MDLLVITWNIRPLPIERQAHTEPEGNIVTKTLMGLSAWSVDEGVKVGVYLLDAMLGQKAHQFAGYPIMAICKEMAGVMKGFHVDV